MFRAPSPTPVGRSITCIGVGRQLVFHTGYAPRDVDRADLALLHALAAG